MLYNINWDVYPDWVRYLDRTENEEHTDNHPRSRQKHTHEFEGSTRLAEEGDDRHNHRFAGVTDEAMPTPHGNHRHKIRTNTDFFEDHFHEIETCTGPAIEVGNGKHVHFVEDRTTVNDGHCHHYQFATLIESPLTHEHDQHHHHR